jgi:hypothetical protein
MRSHGFKRAVQVAAALLLCLGTKNADADLTHSCRVDGQTVPWLSTATPTNVWINNIGSTNFFGALQISQWDGEMAVRRAIAILNEHAGTHAKLQYAGTTSSTTIQGAITIIGNFTSCGVGDTGAPAEMKYGKHFANPVFRWDWSQLVFYRYGLNCAGYYPWSLTPGDISTDLVYVLMHELGHGAFNLGHPNSGSPYYDCFFESGNGNPAISFMGASAETERDLSSWDDELIQKRYGIRSTSAQLFRTYPTSPTTWTPAFRAAASVGVTPLFRMGSMTELRTLAWVDNGVGGGTVRAGGAGYFYSPAQYLNGTLDQWVYVAPSMARTVAMASTTVSGSGPPTDTIIAYQKFVGSNLYSSMDGQICWRHSSNGGATWGLEECLSPGGNPFTTTTFVLTAAYDPYSNSFLLGYVKDLFGTAWHRVHITRVPATGNSNPIFTYTLSASSGHAPSISCTGAAQGCLALYESANGNGSVAGTFFGVLDNNVIHTIQVTSSVTWSLPAFDTPGLTYNAADDTFRMALSENGTAVYSYKLDRSDPTLTWYGTGDIWNSQTNHVSTAVMLRRENGFRLESWFVKYW